MYSKPLLTAQAPGRVLSSHSQSRALYHNQRASCHVAQRSKVSMYIDPAAIKSITSTDCEMSRRETLRAGSLLLSTLVGTATLLPQASKAASKADQRIFGKKLYEEREKEE